MGVLEYFVDAAYRLTQYFQTMWDLFLSSF